MDTMWLVEMCGYRIFDFGFEGEHYKKYFCNGFKVVREVVVLRLGLGVSMS